MRSKSFIWLLIFSLVVAFMALGAQKKSRRAVSQKPKYEAKMNGSEESPSVNTTATGEATFDLSKDGTKLQYKIRVKDIVDPTQAHLHQGAAGQNGDPVATLYPTTKAKQKTGKMSGTLATGTIVAADLTGPLASKTLADLTAMIDAGQIYVNVHTTANPNGEIRGQVAQTK